MRMKDFITFKIDLRTKGTYKLLSTSKNSGNIIYMSYSCGISQKISFKQPKLLRRHDIHTDDEH